MTGGRDAAEEVCVALPEDGGAEALGVGVPTGADAAKELCVVLSDEGAAEGVGVPGEGPGQRTMRP